MDFPNKVRGIRKLLTGHTTCPDFLNPPASLILDPCVTSYRTVECTEWRRGTSFELGEIIILNTPATFSELKVGMHVVCAWTKEMDSVYGWKIGPDPDLDREIATRGTLWSATVKAKQTDGARPVQISFEDGNTKWVYPDMLTIVAQPSAGARQLTDAAGDVKVLMIKGKKKWKFNGRFAALSPWKPK